MGSSKRVSNGVRGNCQDCGNKAKRDCEHKRCRTCCKTRAFQCATHVRSTWVPVSRRRLIAAAASSSALPFHLITSPTSYSSGFQGRIQSFPAEVTSMANFRCVRVTSDDNAVDQAAYQTSVNIGGRVFTGLLYDQGPPDSVSGAESSPNDQLYLHHQLVGLSSAAGGSNMSYLRYPYYASNAPSHMYPGMQFFPHPKP